MNTQTDKNIQRVIEFSAVPGRHRHGTEYPCHADARILRCRRGNFGALFRILGPSVGNCDPRGLLKLAVHQEEARHFRTDERKAGRSTCTDRLACGESPWNVR